MDNRDGFEAVGEQRGGDGGVEAVEGLSRLIAHGDHFCEVVVARGGSGEEEKQARVAVDMGV